MKFIPILLLLVSFCQAQQSESSCIKEVDQLHRKTNMIRDSVGELIRKVNNQISKEVSAATKESLFRSVDSLWNIYDQNEINELKTNIDYSKNHPGCLYSFELVQLQVARQPGKDFYKDFEFVYNNSSSQIRESEIGKKMLSQLKLFKQSMVGSVAPAFNGYDLQNSPIALSDFKSKKYVLIDFWASWCGPCREEVPFLKSLYKSYSSNDFEIISISIDEDLGKWRNTISKENMQQWKNYSSRQNNSSVKTDYFVNGIPHKILVDKNGVIIGKWKATGELNKRQLQNQLTDIFGY
ncbi:MAG: TlpA family protein disulfide reductase [Flavobacterium sp.]|nr:MAG: TlpA family protein disulfide reductase [Flavobacterium sp.]